MKQRTGAAESFSPELEEIIADRTAKLLQDGVSIDEAVQVGLLNNPSFQSAFAEIGASRADVVQSGLLSNPSVGFTLRFPDGAGRSNLIVNLGQELVDLWQIPVKKKIAQAQLDQTVQNAVRQGVDLAAEIRTRYYQLWALETTYAISVQNQELAQSSVDLADKRMRAGEATQLDVNLLKSSLLDVQSALILLDRDRLVARAELAKAMGISRQTQDWKLIDPFGEPVAPLSDEHSLLEWAMQERLDIQMAEAKIRENLAELKKQYLSIVPSFVMGVEWERLERRALPGRNVLADTAIASVRAGQLTAPDIETRGQRNIERRQIINSLLGPTFQVTLPIYDQNQAQIAKAGFKIDQNRRQLEELLNGVAKEVMQSSTMMSHAAELVEFYDKKSLPQSMSNLDLTRKTYEAGEQNVIVLIGAQQSLISQRLAAVNVKRDYFVAKTELERSLGGRMPQPGNTSTQGPGGAPAQ